MDATQIKETIKLFAKQAESIVEQKLGDRSQIENQVKGLVKNFENTVQAFMNQRNGTSGSQGARSGFFGAGNSVF